MGIGLPVRNGERSLPHVLRSLQAQTFEDFAVAIVDNCSGDATGEIAREFCASDRRFRYVRQEAPVTMWMNFKRSFTEAGGEYFMFAADDLYSEDWLASLRQRLSDRPDTMLAFSEDVVVFSDYAAWSTGIRYERGLSTTGIPRWRRLVMDRRDGYAVCGLFRRAELADYRWVDHSTSPDWPLVTYAMVRGDIESVRGPVIYVPRDDAKGGAERVQLQSFGRVERFPAIRLANACAEAAADAERRAGPRRADFLLLTAALIWVGIRRRVRLGIRRIKAPPKRPG